MLGLDDRSIWLLYTQLTGVCRVPIREPERIAVKKSLTGLFPQRMYTSSSKQRGPLACKAGIPGYKTSKCGRSGPASRRTNLCNGHTARPRHDEAMPLVEWARTQWGIAGQRRVCQHDSIHYPLRESLLRDRMPFGAVTEANKELFRTPKGAERSK